MTYRIRNIVIAIALATIAALLVGVYVTSYKKDVESRHETVRVYVAAQDIPAGTLGSVVAEGMLEPRDVARDTLVPAYVTRPEKLASLIVTQRILEGEQVSERRFGPAVATGIRRELTGNRRAIQVAGDQNQLLAGTLQAGDRIDVVASLKFKVRDPNNTSGSIDVDRVASRVVLRDIEVLRTSGFGPTAAKLTSGPSSNTHWAILALTDAQSQKLFFVTKNGDWSLQLRPPLNAADSPNSVETIESVLGDGLRRAQYDQLYGGRSIR